MAVLPTDVTCFVSLSYSFFETHPIFNKCVGGLVAWVVVNISAHKDVVWSRTWKGRDQTNKDVGQVDSLAIDAMQPMLFECWSQK